MAEKFFLTKQKFFIELSFLLALLLTHVYIIYPTYLEEKKNLTDIQIKERP